MPNRVMERQSIVLEALAVEGVVVADRHGFGFDDYDFDDGRWPSFARIFD